jgi:hypothetical protein
VKQTLTWACSSRNSNGELSTPEEVGSAKEGSPAAYCMGDEKHIVFALNSSGDLQDFQYDEDMGAWNEGKLSDLKIQISEKSKLATVFGLGQAHLFFQDLTGKLQEVVSGDFISWTKTDITTLTDPISGSALAAITEDKQVSVFYEHKFADTGFSIHRLSFGGSGWTDTEVKNTTTESPRTALAASKTTKGTYDVQYSDSTGETYSVDVQNGTSLHVGTYKKDGFEKANKAQCGHIIIIIIYCW